MYLPLVNIHCKVTLSLPNYSNFLPISFKSESKTPKRYHSIPLNRTFIECKEKFNRNKYA